MPGVVKTQEKCQFWPKHSRIGSSMLEVRTIKIYGEEVTGIVIDELSSGRKVVGIFSKNRLKRIMYRHMAGQFVLEKFRRLI